ncbi:MAG TPA: succinylglutamate desuccinylase/aspartoacylase family protein [Alphaproteobacteria bacterium]|nr:succinylglutamate desuccinylase/aspartoacylase family protein [Alphaproteobacteria bacterium]
MNKEKKEKRKPFEIGGVTVEPGTTKTIHIPISMLPNQASFNLNLRIIHGRRPGKCLLLSSTIHGDELNGIESIRRVLSSPHIKHLRGTLVALPVVNLIGLLNQTRYLPDRRDLNRSFPGSETGSAAAQLANTFLKEIVEKCTHGIDLHTGSDNRINLSQIRCDFESVETLQMALAFGAPVILKSKLRDGSLREASEKLGIPTILFEGGEALRFNEFAIRSAAQGIMRVMANLGMISQIKCVSAKESPVVSPASRWLRAPSTGIFRTTCNLGKKVLKGDILGKISDPLGVKNIDVTASFDGIVIGRSQLPIVYQGDALFNIAWVPDPAKAEATIEEFAEEDAFDVALGDPITY